MKPPPFWIVVGLVAIVLLMLANPSPLTDPKTGDKAVHTFFAQLYAAASGKPPPDAGPLHP
jgi:hypothetical protein